MRRAFPLLVALCAAVALSQVGGASGAQSSYWIPFHIHLNAYAHWGSCSETKHGGPSAHWQRFGICKGTIEAGHLGSIIDYGPYHSNTADWTWTVSESDVRKFTLHLGPLSIGKFEGTMPYNWHTLRVTRAEINGRGYFSGYTQAKGEPGGPLYVDLSSHTYFVDGDLIGYGYSLDLRGYLAPYT